MESGSRRAPVFELLPTDLRVTHQVEDRLDAANGSRLPKCIFCTSSFVSRLEPNCASMIFFGLQDHRFPVLVQRAEDLVEFWQA